jgi:pimeloyl-ACP methyl ester carboxylesterase
MTELSFVQLPGGRLAYRRAGVGPPLLLIHGWGGSSRHWLGAFATLAERHDLIAPDLPGFGASPPPPGPVTLATLTAAALGLIDALGLPTLAVAGHSLGAAVALLAAAARPGQVARLALASFGLPRSPSEAAAMAGLHAQMRAGASLWAPWLSLWGPWLAATRPLREAAWATPPLPALLAGPMVHRVADLPPAALALGAADLAAMDARAAVEAVATTGDPSVVAAAGEVRAPALVVSGRHDRIFPPDAALALQGALAGAGLVMLERCGHVPMVEAPAAFYATLAEFLAP